MCRAILEQASTECHIHVVRTSIRIRMSCYSTICILMTNVQGQATPSTGPSQHKTGCGTAYPTGNCQKDDLLCSKRQPPHQNLPSELTSAKLQHHTTNLVKSDVVQRELIRVCAVIHTSSPKQGRTTMRCHFPGWTFFGITLKLLTCRKWNGGEANRPATLPKDTLLAKY